MSKKALDLGKQWPLVNADERDGVAFLAGTTGAADPVDVVGRDHGQLIVDDVRQRVDVEAPRRDLGRDQNRNLVLLEVGQCAHALRLALVAMDRDGGDAIQRQLLNQAIRAVLRAGEDECLIDAAGLNELAEQLALA